MNSLKPEELTSGRITQIETKYSTRDEATAQNALIIGKHSTLVSRRPAKAHFVTHVPVSPRKLRGFFFPHSHLLFLLPPLPLIGFLVSFHFPPLFPGCPGTGCGAELGKLKLAQQLRRLPLFLAFLSLQGLGPVI